MRTDRAWQRWLISLISAVALSFCLLLSPTCAASGSVLRVSDGRVISFGQMIREIRGANFVFVGESHDSMRDHAIQLEIIQALHEADIPLAIGLEMFMTGSQKILDRWTSGRLGLDRFLDAYYDNWRLPWPLYRDIFLYAREHTIPMAALNVPDEIIRKVSQRGFASLTPAEKSQLPQGISCNVDPAYMDFIRKAYRRHAQDSSFLYFCEAQMVWDRSMAFHLEDYLNKNADRTVVVLAGIGHAWKRGIPEHLKKGSAGRSRVILPEVPGHVDKDIVSIADADYIVLAEP
ncbi:MAG TPA: ChaN family lipoprotein [Thermodesulfovibrionales bacterium]|nr:ChaN family lipoprotein [Thermodesulfovibrionales bacterium]